MTRRITNFGDNYLDKFQMDPLVLDNGSKTSNDSLDCFNKKLLEQSSKFCTTSTF